ncbi:MAG: DUF3524 domain-containing protein [Acidobacteriota bacterium]
MPRPLRLLALEPYDGGSHRAFLAGWRRHSRHTIDCLGLPAHHWKWRMRHAAVTFADRVHELLADGAAWDAVFASSMLDLASFRGLAPRVATLPTVVYFHENQLTYPDRRADARDLHFAFTHLTTGLAADAVWIASAFHRDELLDAVGALVARLPERRLVAVPERLESKLQVLPQGIEPLPERSGERAPGPLRIVWAARWEHDKNPEGFFAALDRLAARGVGVRVDVLGESFRRIPDVFARGRAEHAERIGRWGFVDRAEYRAGLAAADVFVSTARHEFFGVAAAEAGLAGCFPLLPERLAYPELLADVAPGRRGDFFYAGGSDAGDDSEAETRVLASRLEELAQRVDAAGRDGLWRGEPTAVRDALQPLAWPRVATRLDAALEALAERVSGTAGEARRPLGSD